MRKKDTISTFFRQLISQFCCIVARQVGLKVTTVNYCYTCPTPSPPPRQKKKAAEYTLHPSFQELNYGSTLSHTYCKRAVVYLTQGS